MISNLPPVPRPIDKGLQIGHLENNTYVANGDSVPFAISSLPGSPHDLLASFYFLDPSSIPTDEKLYKLLYDPGDFIPRTNLANVKHDSVIVQDIRGCKKAFTWDKNGFYVAELDSHMMAEDFLSAELVEGKYYQQLKDLLSSLFQPRHVEIMEHRVRRRDAQFPKSTGEDYEFGQPTMIVHNDFTPASAWGASQKMLQGSKSMASYDRIVAVNIWKPLRGPLTDWPLAICDEATVVPNDYVPVDTVFRRGFTENFQIKFNARHKWYYLSQQNANEVIIFRQNDTSFPVPNGDVFKAQSDGFRLINSGVPHSGFQNHESKSDEAPRESIEVRAFLYY